MEKLNHPRVIRLFETVRIRSGRGGQKFGHVCTQSSGMSALRLDSVPGNWRFVEFRPGSICLDAGSPQARR